MPRGWGRSGKCPAGTGHGFFMPETAGALAVIPARYGSRRLPAKVLAPIAGRSMLEHVWHRTGQAQTVERVVVATDDDRVREAALVFAAPADVVMTGPNHACGTDRIAEVARTVPASLYVNVQADMPLLDPALIDATVAALKADPELGMATAAVPIADDELANHDVVKITLGADGRALGFFRQYPDDQDTAYHHVGIYAFRRQTLLRFAELGPSPLEHTEGLEQLRALENGIAIGVALLHISGHLSVDSSKELEAARKEFEEDKLSGQVER